MNDTYLDALKGFLILKLVTEKEMLFVKTGFKAVVCLHQFLPTGMCLK
jgi:hypothetical protein